MLFKLFFSLFLFSTLCLIRIEAASQPVTPSFTGSGTSSPTDTISNTMTGTQSSTFTATQTDTQTTTPSWTISPSVSFSTSNAYFGIAFFNNTCQGAAEKCCLQWKDATGSPADYYTITFTWVFAGVTYTVPFNISFNVSNAIFTGLNASQSYTITIQAFRFISSKFPGKSQIQSITFMTGPLSPCDNPNQGVTHIVVNTAKSSHGTGMDVTLTWTNGPVAYVRFEVDIACKHPDKNKHGKLKTKDYRDLFFVTPGQTSWLALKDVDVVSCKIKNNARVFYAGGCCLGCDGHHRYNNH